MEPCKKCGSTDRRGKEKRCHPCRKAGHTAWCQRNAEKYKAHKAKYHVNNLTKVKSTQLKYKYGITGEQKEAMFIAQGGLCKICVSNKATDVDHCHTTGKVRGLLCRACNNAIGLLKENTETLQNAMNYLQEK